MNPVKSVLRSDPPHGVPLEREEDAASPRFPVSVPGPERALARLGENTRTLLDSVHDLNALLADDTDGVRDQERAIVARSPHMHRVLDEARRVAGSKVSVLIEGESGTGKELVARLIHGSSPRARKHFVRVNCAALSDSLVESELFGHEKGAFTGAAESHAGRFEWADGGTLLLDEISEMSVRLQAKLLRVLEEEEFERVGGNRTLHVDVRVIATTNRNLEREVAQGQFRGDLYYRLNAVQLRLPPLRVRREDITPLVEHFLTQYRHEASVPLQRVSANALEILSAHDWPGNVRQLRNVIHRACILASRTEIQPEDLPPLEQAAPPGAESTCQTLAEMERAMILRTLHQLGGNKTATAHRLGITTRTLLNKMNRYRTEAACDLGDPSRQGRDQ